MAAGCLSLQSLRSAWCRGGLHLRLRLTCSESMRLRVAVITFPCHTNAMTSEPSTLRLALAGGAPSGKGLRYRLRWAASKAPPGSQCLARLWELRQPAASASTLGGACAPCGACGLRVPESQLREGVCRERLAVPYSSSSSLDSLLLQCSGQ